MKPTITFLLTHPLAKMPEYATKGASGADIFAVEDYRIEPGHRALVQTGLKADIPEGFEIQVRAKSGRALKEGLTMANGIGTIDSDYRGEIGAILLNTSDKPVLIKAGEKVAQLVVVPVQQAEFVGLAGGAALSETARGEGGFGSTGLQSSIQLGGFFGDP